MGIGVSCTALATDVAHADVYTDFDRHVKSVITLSHDMN